MGLPACGELGSLALATGLLEPNRVFSVADGPRSYSVSSEVFRLTSELCPDRSPAGKAVHETLTRGDSRRLAFVALLPETIQQQVRDGKIVAHVAMKCLVPVTRSVAGYTRNSKMAANIRRLSFCLRETATSGE